MSDLLTTENQNRFFNETLKKFYDQQYQDHFREWRMLGARSKSDNILRLCKGYSFKKIVEMGAGDGSVLYHLGARDIFEELSAVELSESALEILKKQNIHRLKTAVLFDGYQTPFGDKEFDLAICTHVMEHVEFPRLLLREIKRISKYQLFEIPVDFSLFLDKKINHFLSYGHINIFTPALFRFLLVSEGFEIRKNLNGMYPDEVYRFLYKKKPSRLLLARIKKVIWKVFPVFLSFKPDTFTVLTRS